MQVGGAKRGPTDGGEHRPHRAVRGDGVRGRREAPKRIISVVVGAQARSARYSAVAVLDVVEPVVVGLPPLDLGTDDRVPGSVGDGALDPAWLSGRTAGDVA